MAEKIKGITIRINGDTKDLNSALKSMDSELRKTDNELKSVNRLLKFNPGNATLLKQKQSLLNNEIQQTRNKLTSMKDAQKSVTAEMKKQNPEQYRKLEREIIATENKLKGLVTQEKKVNYQLSQLGMKSAKIRDLGNKLQGVGSKMKYISGASSGAIAGSAKFAVSTEKNMATVNSILGLSGKEWEKYENKLKTGAKEIGKSYDEYAEAAYQAISASVKQTKVTGFLKDASILAKGGLTSLRSSVDLLTTVENAYNISADKTSHISDVLIQTQNKGKTTVDQLAASMGKVIPTAKSAGVLFEQLGASYAIMTRNGVSTKIATTQINSLISELSKSGTKADLKLRAMAGGSFRELMEKGMSVGDVLEKLNEIAAENGQSIQDMFGNVNAGKAAYTILKEGASGYNKELKGMINSTGIAGKAAKTMGDTTQAKLTKAIAQAKNAAADFGAEVLPMITPLITKATDLVKEFGSLDPATRKLIVTGGAALAVASPLASGLGALTKGTSFLIDKVGIMTTKTGEAATKSSLLRSATGKLFTLVKANPWLMVAGAMGIAAVQITKSIIGTNELTDAQKKNQKAREKAIANSQQEAQTAKVYADQLDALMGKEKKTAADKQLIKEYVDKLNGSVKGLNLKYNEEKDALNKGTGAIRKRIAAMKEEALANAYKEQMGSAAKEIAKNELNLAEATKRHEAAKKKLEEAKKNYASREEIGKLEGQVRKEKQAMEDASRAIKKGKKELEGYGAAVTKLDAKNSFKKLSKDAGLAGKDIPKALSQGIESGRVAVPQSVNNLKRLVKFYDFAQKAKIAGSQIPAALANGVASGEMTVKSAQERLKNWMSVKSAVTDAGLDASKIPKSIKEGILSDKISVKKATSLIKAQAKKGANTSLKKEGKKATESYNKGIKSVNTKRPAKGKAQEAKKGSGEPKFSPEGKKSASEWISAFGKGDFKKKGSSMAGQAKKGTGTVKFGGAGADAASGYAGGATSADAFSRLFNAGIKMAKKLLGGVKKGQKSSSPAKEFEPLGGNASEGYAIGATEKLQLLEKTGRSMAKSMISGASKADISVGNVKASSAKLTAAMSKRPEVNLRTETGSVGNDIANIMMMALNRQGASQMSPQELKVTLYMYPNGPKCGETTVKLYDQYKKRIG